MLSARDRAGGAVMNWAQFRKALQTIHWSQRTLSDVLACSPRLVRMWANAESPVPAEVADYLEALEQAHRSLPPAPTNYRRQRGPAPRAQNEHPR
jgi:hypothetical protein